LKFEHYSLLSQLNHDCRWFLVEVVVFVSG
jgi:hypothetical protein